MQLIVEIEVPDGYEEADLIEVLEYLVREGQEQAKYAVRDDDGADDPEHTTMIRAAAACTVEFHATE